VSPDVRRSGPFIAVGGLAVAAFLYGYTAIALPSVLHSLVLPAVWLVLFVLACRWFTTHPYRALSLPFLAVALWFVVMLGLGASA
jgi:hypothetical protein